MKRSAKTVKAFASSVTKAITKTLAWGGALTALATGGGLVLLVKSAFSTVDAMSKMSDRIGITTEKLGALQFAAEIMGASTEALNKGLLFLAKTLGEAKQGIGEGKQALDSLNLSFKDFLGKSPDEQIRILADAFGRLGTQEEKAFIASKLLGRGGLALINLLDLGRSGIDKLEKRFKQLGGGFSRVAGRMVENANDAVTELKFAFKFGGESLATLFSPFVLAAANELTDLAVSGNKWRDSMIDNAESVADAFRLVVNSIAEASREFFIQSAALKETVAERIGQAKRGRNLMRNTPRAFLNIAGAAALGGNAREVAAAGMSGLFGGATPEADSANSLRRSAERDLVRAAEIGDKIKKGADAVKRAFDAIRKAARDAAENPPGAKKPSGDAASFLQSLLGKPSSVLAAATSGNIGTGQEINRQRVNLKGLSVRPVVTVLKQIRDDARAFFLKQNKFQFGGSAAVAVTV